MLTLDDHPLLDVGCFVTTFGTPLEQNPSPDWLQALLALDSETPFKSDDDVRQAVRKLLRHGGYKPTGRGKPASEYLLRAGGDGSLGSINTAVDANNVASLHSGLPISVVDLDRAVAPFRIGIADDGAEYVFNASDQVIRLTGLLCLHDADGPCANAVKDCQRTKTNDQTTRTLSIVWGTTALPGRTAATTAWYRSLLEKAAAVTSDVAV